MIERVLVTGASGLLGSSVALFLYSQGINVLGVIRSNRAEFPFATVTLDLTVEAETKRLVNTYQPTSIVHAAALSKVIECEQNPDLAFKQNVLATEILVKAVQSQPAYFIYISTDQVFDGKNGNYSEDDLPAPSHVYGKTKFTAEQSIPNNIESFLIARSNNIVGQNVGWGRSFTDGLLDCVRKNQPVDLFTDQMRSPVHLRSITVALVKCIEQRIRGILHLGGPEKLSRYETGLQLAQASNIPIELFHPVSMVSHPQALTLHRDGSFCTKKFRTLFPALGEFTVKEGFRRDNELIPYA